MALREVVSICKEELFWWQKMPGCLLQRTWVFETVNSYLKASPEHQKAKAVVVFPYNQQQL